MQAKKIERLRLEACRGRKADIFLMQALKLLMINLIFGGGPKKAYKYVSTFIYAKYVQVSKILNFCGEDSSHFFHFGVQILTSSKIEDYPVTLSACLPSFNPRF